MDITIRYGFKENKTINIIAIKTILSIGIYLLSAFFILNSAVNIAANKYRPQTI